MTSSESKPSAPSSPWRKPSWAAAYALAALALAGSFLLVWWLESHRPWQEEVAAINRQRAALLEKRLRASGTPSALAAARAAEMAAQPPKIIEITPAATGRPERCLTCHQGIAQISPSHPPEAVGCVVCHGGQAMALTKAEAHRGLLGRNPSDLTTARASCGGSENVAGRCHAGREEPAANMVERVERTIMATMTGVITSLRVAWAAQDSFHALYASAAVNDPAFPKPPPPGAVSSLLAIPGGPPQNMTQSGLADEHWRKFCARCHLRAQREAGPSAHGAGCAACHGSRTLDGRYHGADAAINRDEPGHAASHELFPVPPDEACRRCHNRSGRVGLNYQGWMEDESGRTPWPNANPQYTLSGGRSVRRLLSDVHAEKGMGCIDCHTGREIMGDHRIYARMRYQTEIRCATCHGAPGKPPSFGPPDGTASYEAAYGPLRQYPPLTPQSQVGITAKGRSFAALRPGPKGAQLLLRSQSAEPRLCTDISSDPKHALPGHQRLACQACHSRWTPQCYGCHDYRRADGQLWDYSKGKPTPGRWQETRDLYRFLEPLLGVDSRGSITTFVPGCQVMLSVLDQQGNVVNGKSKEILRAGPAGNGIIMTPIAAHTTRKEVRPCEDCHMNPRVLGLGWGPRRLGRMRPQPLSDLSSVNWPADWTALVDGEGRPLQGMTHQGARPLNRREISKVLRFARCLPCHRKPQDPVLKDPALAYKRIAPGGDLYTKHQAQEAKALK